MDDSTKNVLVDTTKTIREIIVACGEKVGVKDPEEYAMRRLDMPDSI